MAAPQPEASSDQHIQVIQRSEVCGEADGCDRVVYEPARESHRAVCDEKTQIQALNRTQPGLPLKKGRCGTMTHDYKRNGTTDLFAALDLLEGKVIADCYKRHRHQEFLKFLRRIDREFSGDTALHLVMD